MSRRTPNGFLGDNYPRNMWWVAGRVDEITTTPLARWLFELPVVLYRTEGWHAGCARRPLPLIDGRRSPKAGSRVKRSCAPTTACGSAQMVVARWSRLRPRCRQTPRSVRIGCARAARSCGSGWATRKRSTIMNHRSTSATPPTPTRLSSLATTTWPAIGY